MKTKSCITFVVFLLVGMNVMAQDGAPKYPVMASLEQYLIADRDMEIALARSAAPQSISENAEILILNRHGFETAVKGTNGFVCVVERSWSAGIDDPDFWNPKLRAPICFNAAGARSQVPGLMKKTKLVLAGRSKTEIFVAIRAAIEKKELPTPEPGAMCYMMSKQGYLSDRDGHWRPHLMFFLPQTDPKNWGAGFLGSPVIGFENSTERLTLFLLPVDEWSDGTPAPNKGH
jgi:hypothetical protein